MSEQRNLSQSIVAISSVVVAACAVTVTIKVLNTDVISVDQRRVLDQAALERQVAAAVSGVGDDPGDRVACPASVVVEVGNQFDCRVFDGTNPKTVRVKIINEQGQLSVTAGR